MSYKCLFDCRHPLWGGTGICIEDDLTIVGRCSCDTGYSTRDAAGYPSCVPKRVLVVLYLVLGLSGLLSAALNLWHASLYRHLSMQFQAARRATIRMRVLMAGSGYTLGVGVLGVFLATRAGEIALWDNGIVQFFYIAAIPLSMLTAAMFAEFWVEALPSQLLRPDSFEAKLKEGARKYQFFVGLGVLGMGSCSACGVMTFFVHPLWPVRVTDLCTALGGVLSVSKYVTARATFILFIGVHITRSIDTLAGKHTSAASKLFYGKAKKNIWLQVNTIVFLGLILVVAAAVRHLTVIGRGTPLLLNTIQISTGIIAFGMFACVTKFEQPERKGNHGVKVAVRPMLTVLLSHPMTPIQSMYSPSSAFETDKEANGGMEGSTSATYGNAVESFAKRLTLFGKVFPVIDQPP